MTNISTGISPSPLGLLEIIADEESIKEIRFLGETDRVRSKDNTVLVKQCMEELDAYFGGSLKSFSIPISPEGSPFELEVWRQLQNIPFGTTINYEALAIRLGDMKKIRAAAKANGKNPIPIIIPCHRVIGKNGHLVGYAGGLKRKEELLIHEGAIGKQVAIFKI
jgi:methylated-DNA-[protein]-cysteine S-methyltransferase